jgi:uroporphyrinogen-III synthase
MRILIPRPEPDAARQAEKVARLGHEPVVAPLIDIEFLDGVPLDLRGADALIVTSRNALRALRQNPQRNDALQLPLYVVGQGTAKEAARLGFNKITAGPGTGAELAGLIARERNGGGTLLHLSGETTAFDLKAALEAEGFGVRQAILYRSVQAKVLPADVAAMIEAGRLDGVILMSPLTATTFTRLVRQQGLLSHASRLICYCLSQAVAQAVEPLGAEAIVAMRPREEDVLALLAAEAAS